MTKFPWGGNSILSYARFKRNLMNLKDHPNTELELSSVNWSAGATQFSKSLNYSNNVSQNALGYCITASKVPILFITFTLAVAFDSVWWKGIWRGAEGHLTI